MDALRKITFTLLTASFALIVYAMGPSASAALQFERSAMAAGEWWRIVTGHFTHWSADHFAWDFMMFALLGGACEVRSRRRFLVTLLMSSVTIPLAILMFQPQLRTYRGLSGLDSALFGLLAVELLGEKWAGGDRRSIMAIALLIAAFLVKTAVEVVTGAAVFADSRPGGFAPVPLAHLVGFIAGALAPVVARGRRTGTGMQPRLTPLRWPRYEQR